MLTAQTLYHTPHKIWKILFDEKADYAVLEVRDEDLREAFFVAINWPQGEVLWDEGYLEEEWWISLAGLSDGRLFAHLLHEEQEPTPKALLALDIAEAEGLWEVPSTALLAASPKSLQVSQEGEERWISPETGTPLPDSSGYASPEPSWQLPSRYLQEEPHFNTVAAFLKNKGFEAIGAIDYWETEQYLCIGFYELEGIYYRNQLLILTRSGDEAFRCLLQDGAKGMGTEAFALQGNYLFYIQDKRTLQRIYLA